MKCGDIEVYLSGYLDEELSDDEKRQVESHLETCASCQEVLNQLRKIREETEAMNYVEPSHQEWRRIEKSIFGTISRGLGWIVLMVWAVVTSVYACLEYFSSPAEPLSQKILVFAFFLGFGLLFLSVLSERIRDSRTDRYKGVER